MCKLPHPFLDIHAGFFCVPKHDREVFCYSFSNLLFSSSQVCPVEVENFKFVKTNSDILTLQFIKNIKTFNISSRPTPNQIPGTCSFPFVSLLFSLGLSRSAKAT